MSQHSKGKQFNASKHSPHQIRSSGPSKVNSNSSAVSTNATTRALLAPNTSIGQHFLKNPAVVDAIIHKSHIQPTDTVLEVGPGTGNLTVKMLPLCKKLVAVEYDVRMVREVLKRVEGSAKEHCFSVIQGDVMKVSLISFLS